MAKKAKDKWTNNLGEDNVIDVQAETTDIQPISEGSSAVATTSTWDDFASEQEYSGYRIKGEKRIGSDKVIIQTPEGEDKVNSFTCVITEPPMPVYTLFDTKNNVMYKSYNRNPKRGQIGVDTQGEDCNVIQGRVGASWQFKAETKLMLENYDGEVFEWTMPATGYYSLKKLAREVKENKGLNLDRCVLKMTMSEYENPDTKAIYIAPKFEFVEEMKA